MIKNKMKRRRIPMARIVKRQAPRFQEQLLRDARYPGHAVLQVSPRSFYIFLLSQEAQGAVIHAMADQLIRAESYEQAFEAVRQMDEFNRKQQTGLLVPSHEPIQLVRENGAPLK